MLHLTDNIQAIRKLIAYSQQQFGALFGVSGDVISAYERGVTIMPEPFVAEVAVMCRITANDLKSKPARNLSLDAQAIRQAAKERKEAAKNVVRNGPSDKDKIIELQGKIIELQNREISESLGCLHDLQERFEVFAIQHQRIGNVLAQVARSMGLKKDKVITELEDYSLRKNP